MVEERTPEARNLSIACFGIIVYYYAGGYFEADQLTLEVVNLSFTDFGRLKLFLWGMTCWFAFRYYLEEKGRFRKALFEGASKDIQHERHASFITERTPVQQPHAVTKIAFSHLSSAPEGHLQLVFDESFAGKISSQILVPLKSAVERQFVATLMLRSLIRHPEGTRYGAPILLFLAAISAPLIANPPAPPAHSKPSISQMTSFPTLRLDCSLSPK